MLQLFSDDERLLVIGKDYLTHCEIATPRAIRLIFICSRRQRGVQHRFMCIEQFRQ